MSKANEVKFNRLLKRLCSRRDVMIKHITDLIMRDCVTEADGWEFRLIELRHIVRMVRRSNKQPTQPKQADTSRKG